MTIQRFDHREKNPGLGLCALLFFALSLSPPATACTIFQSPMPNDSEIAHNVDWGYPAMPVEGALFLNPAQVRKKGELAGASVVPATWVSRLRSLTFSIAGAEFPVSGFNEAGLTMGVLELPETKYPDAGDARPGVSVSQFVQYNLDMSETIDDVIASDKVIRPYSSVVRDHYFACDRTRACVVLQYIDGKMTAYRGANLPHSILTNSLYPASVEAARQCTAVSCDLRDNSLWRFAEAKNALDALDLSRPFEAQAFGVLGGVTQAMTKFQLLFDAANRTVKARPMGAEGFGWLAANFEEASCKKPRMALVIDRTTGDLSGKWVPLTLSLQTEMLRHMGYPDALIPFYANYPFSTECLEP